jgi:hypothetical protein
MAAALGRMLLRRFAVLRSRPAVGLWCVLYFPLLHLSLALHLHLALLLHLHRTLLLHLLLRARALLFLHLRLALLLRLLLACTPLLHLRLLALLLCLLLADSLFLQLCLLALLLLGARAFLCIGLRPPLLLRGAVVDLLWCAFDRPHHGQPAR